MQKRRAVILASFVLLASCGKKAPTTSPAASATPASPAAPSPATPSGAPAVVTPPGAPPPDGKYERVQVDGVTVPMNEVMNGGQVLLVDTDGVKPRSWEEQYKRKRDLPKGQYDLHKTNTNKNDTFEDDAIDREGLWVIDAKGNVTRH